MTTQPASPFLSYVYKTQPYDHQRAAFEATRDEAILAVLWEMGTGKSKLILDQAAWNYQRGVIDGLLIWAPAGVHRLWNDLEVPKHLPDQIPRCTVTWLSGRMESRAARDDLTTLLSYDGLSILTMNVEAAITKHGLAFATKFMKARRTMAVCDECFVAGTPVLTPRGEVPIEVLQPADLVLTPSGPMPIRRAFHRQTLTLATIHLAGGGLIRCTPDHPFLTQRGWLCAQDLAGEVLLDHNATLRMVREGVSQSCQTWTPAEVLRHILLSEMANASARNSSSDLYPGAQPEDEPGYEGHAQTLDQAAQTTTDRGPPGQAQRYPSGHGSPASDYGRQWPSNTTTSADVDESARSSLGGGVASRIGEVATRLSYALQHRSGLLNQALGTGNRRAEPPSRSGPGTRSEARRQAARTRVVGVEVDQLAGPRDVYDLELVGDPRFFAAGVLVHNSQVIKNPGAARTKRLIALGKQAVMRRITTGTPITQGPLDLFTQFNFLQDGLLGHRSYWAFKHEFAQWRQVHLGGRKFEELVSYRNLDRLTARCAAYSIRATKEECLDLPPKVYTQRRFSLTPHQRQVYDQLRDEYIAELTTQTEVKVVHVLTRLLRLQQITSGYWPETREGIECPNCHGAGCDPCHDLGMVIQTHPAEDLVEKAKNPRLLATLDLLENNPGSMIIWCRFRYDVDLLVKHIPDAVRYDGSTSSDDRARAVARFQNGSVRVLVGTPRAGGRGLTLTRASTVLYYSHDFSYETRIQSEDRAHRIGLQHSVTYVDLVAEDSVDRHLLDVVAGKRDLASLFDRTDPAAFLR